MSGSLILRVRAALSAIKDPASGRNIIAAGLVSGLATDDAGKVRFAVEVPDGDKIAAEAILNAAKSAAASVQGVSGVSAVATAHSAAPSQPAKAAPKGGGHDNPFGLKQKPRIESAGETLGGVKSVIAIASGKGGVGKSTIAANLAVALGARGLKVGLLDADIYGPSLPTLFGISGKPEMRGSKIVPFESLGVRLMSIGFLVNPEEAVAWRGPMVMGAIRQLISDVDWGDLDILLIDTPPGTGDAHISLIQTKRLAGAVIVSTPQEMALADVRRGVHLFRQTNTPVAGVIENMAWLETPDGTKQFLFGERGAENAAKELDAPFLGAVPLFPDLRQASDDGRPVAGTDHPAAAVFAALAEKIAAFASAT